jgi:outer membrane protein assembly factor BamA
MGRLCHTFSVQRVVLALAIIGAIIGSLAGRAAAEEIEEIVVEGNTKTTSDTVELIAQIDNGDDWKNDMVDAIKARLVSSGLFSDVEVFWEPSQGGVRVHILVKDKHSWVIAPALYDQPTNKGAGVGYGENNLFGENQKLLLYGQIATGDSFFVGAWVLPSIAGSRFYAQVDTFLKDSRNIEYAAPTKYIQDPIAVRESRIIYLNGGFKLGVELLRGVKIDARIRAAHLGYQDVKLCSSDTSLGVAVDSNCVHGQNATLADLGPAGLVAPGAEGWDISNEYQFTVDRRANWYGVYTGHKYQLSYEYSLGSDFHYHRFGALLYQAWQVLERHNLVFKANFNVGHHMPFQQELLTGGTSMRGWLNNQFRGDFQALGNAEYSLPLFTIAGLSVRGLGFWDSAYTTFLTTSNPERNYLPSSQFVSGNALAGFKNSVGGGIRLYLRQIVLPLLGLDVGYGLEAGDVQVYLAIGLTD